MPSLSGAGQGERQSDWPGAVDPQPWAWAPSSPGSNGHNSKPRCEMEVLVRKQVIKGLGQGVLDEVRGSS